MVLESGFVIFYMWVSLGSVDLLSLCDTCGFTWLVGLLVVTIFISTAVLIQSVGSEQNLRTADLKCPDEAR